jgi:hypothetical protein
VIFLLFGVVSLEFVPSTSIILYPLGSIRISHSCSCNAVWKQIEKRHKVFFINFFVCLSDLGRWWWCGVVKCSVVVIVVGIKEDGNRIQLVLFLSMFVITVIQVLSLDLIHAC